MMLVRITRKQKYLEVREPQMKRAKTIKEERKIEITKDETTKVDENNMEAILRNVDKEFEELVSIENKKHGNVDETEMSICDQN